MRERIIERRIKRVVIGVIDPNDVIRGRGELRLRNAGIDVALFDADLMDDLEELNRDFTRQHAGAAPVERTAAQTSEPATDETGPNGHRVGYTEEGDKVEWIPDPEGSGEEFPILLRRNDKALLAQYNELRDKVWWNRHQAIRRRVDNGEEPMTEARAEALATGDEAAARIEALYRRDELELDEFEFGLLNGRLSALAWILGAEWDESLDT